MNNLELKGLDNNLRILKYDQMTYIAMEVILGFIGEKKVLKTTAISLILDLIDKNKGNIKYMVKIKLQSRYPKPYWTCLRSTKPPRLSNLNGRD